MRTGWVGWVGDEDLNDPDRSNATDFGFVDEVGDIEGEEGREGTGEDILSYKKWNNPIKQRYTGFDGFGAVDGRQQANSLDSRL